MKPHSSNCLSDPSVTCHRSPSPITLTLASDKERQMIYRIRHLVYAAELGQHRINPNGQLKDALDDWNSYLVATIEREVAGFISVTPPGSPTYSIDKYFSRDQIPCAFDGQLYEIRLLTVLKDHRGRELAALLMYGALRWVEAHGGTRIVAIGRREILGLYLRVGLTPIGLSAQSGAVIYDLLLASTREVREKIAALSGLIGRLEEKTDWRLPFPFQKPDPCFHGGAFFNAIGAKFDALERNKTVINADVLDAWFPPAPGVLASLQDHLPWLLRTSPPTACEGLIETIARARGVAPGNILPGAGSSDLIFRALRHWLTPESHALILDPTYGEYAHVLERVIGCTVDRLRLDRANDYAMDVARLEAALADHYDLVVLVNPNNPTGTHLSRLELERVIQNAPPKTRFWIDEAYVDYLGSGESLERFAARSENTLVCKSMSKVYALSGARVAYLCAGPHQLETLRAITPPWVVSLPAQVAAVRALEDPDYYATRYQETHALQESLARELRSLDWEVRPGVANFLLCHLPEKSLDAEALIERCGEQGLFLRNAGLMGMGPDSVRVAVKDAETNRRMVNILQEVTGKHSGQGRPTTI
ncbi:MAG: aminotransferase class I/II-fold pyridoxal phosphate-dependent enzyme [Verrucomicrobia bacterium]|nr:aminotransferase class I/II-fold pyridoxal phosphate-dependent enzyme [Verrucomicrobiota bacterium]